MLETHLWNTHKIVLGIFYKKTKNKKKSDDSNYSGSVAHYISKYPVIAVTKTIFVEILIGLKC